MRTKILYLLIVFSFVNLTASAQQFTCGIFTFDAIITPPTCNGGCDGSIQITNITGGTPPYTFLWSNGEIDSTVFGLCSGNYNLIITDGLGNTCSMVLNVPTPTPITFSLVATPVSCYGFSDGSICLDSLSGGTPPYIYSWNTVPIQAAPCATNLSTGTYIACITDAIGCTVCDTATVLEPAEIQVIENVTNASCPSCCDGEIVLFPSGGTPSYNYVFTPSGSPINLCPGTYSYCVTDMNGCTTCDTVVVSFPTAIKNNADLSVFSVYPNPFKDKIYLNTTEQFVEVYSILGEKIKQDYTNEIDLTTLKSGMYYLVIKDSDGNPIQKEKIVKE